MHFANDYLLQLLCDLNVFFFVTSLSHAILSALDAMTDGLPCMIGHASNFIKTKLSHVD